MGQNMNILRSGIVWGLTTLNLCWCASSWAQWPVGSISPIKPQSLTRLPATASLQAAAHQPWKAVARTVRGRSLEVAAFGQASSQVLIVGPLAGDEPAALGLMDKLAQELMTHESSAVSHRAVMLRDPNPDGRVLRIRANARGVDLDTNFPAASWQKRPAGLRWLSDPQPASEPETRAVLNLLAQTRPQWILLLAAHDGAARVDWAGPAQALAEGMQKSAAVGQNVGEQLSGSLLSYAGRDRNIPTLLLTLNNQETAQAAWEAHGPGLLALLGMPASTPPASVQAVQTPYSGSSLPPSVPSANPPTSAAHSVSHTLPSQPAPPEKATEPLPKVRIRGATSLSPWKAMVRVELPSTPTELPPLGHPASNSSPASSSVFWPAHRIERLPPIWQQGE